MGVSKYVVLSMAAAFAAAAAPVLALQTPDRSAATAPAVKTPAQPKTNSEPSTGTAPADDADETTDLIAKANATAAQNAKAEEVPPVLKVAKYEPTAEARKKAEEFGFHPEIYDGKTMFCRDDATLGTRIPSKKCMDADQFEEYGTMLKIARDLMRSKTVCEGGKPTGDLCGGLQ